MEKIKGGLTQQKFFKRHDPRRFSYSKSFGAFDIALLPNNGIGRQPTAIKDQKTTDFCALFSGAAVREDTEGVQLSPFMTWAYAAYLRGDYKSWGMDLENARRAICKFGFIEETETDFTANMDRDFLAQLKNYPQELIEKAKKHKAESGFWIDGDYSFFDNCRVALWQNKSANLSILTGCDFKFSWLGNDKGIIDDYDKKEQSFGHAIKIYDWCEIGGELYLKAQLSNGMIGDNGIMYFHKSIINSPLFRFGGLMFIDEDPNKVKKEQWNIIAKIIDAIEKILKLMFQQTEIIKKEEEMIKTINNDISPEAKPIEPKYDWSIPEKARKSVRIICDEEGMILKQKNEICDTINCESGFKTNLIHHNKNGTSDYGIIMANSHWYIGEGKPIASIDEAINNPEKCIRVMCEMWRKKRMKDWICYRKLFLS